MTFDLSEAELSISLSQRDRYRYFNVWLALATLLPVMGVAAFNIIVNPYGLYPVPIRGGFNQAKPSKSDNTRMFKASAVVRHRPNTVFLSSSRTDYGLDPEHPLFANETAYNLRLGAATLYDIRRYLEHAIANQPDLKRVVINVDEFIFHVLNVENPTFAEQGLERRGPWLMDIINTTVSLDALNASRKNLRVSKANPDYQSYQPDGQLNLRPIDQQQDKTDYRFRTSIGFYFQFFPGEYELSRRYLDEFFKLIELCQQHGIDYKVYISPSHVTRWDAIRAAGHWSQYEHMKRELVKITPVWDFLGYNSITTEPLQSEMEHYIDDSHYTEAVGDSVFNRMYDYQDESVPDDFGFLITEETIESHLQQIEADRAAWATTLKQRLLCKTFTKIA